MRFQLAQLKAQIFGPISIHNEGGQVTTISHKFILYTDFVLRTQTSCSHLQNSSETFICC